MPTLEMMNIFWNTNNHERNTTDVVKGYFEKFQFSFESNINPQNSLCVWLCCVYDPLLFSFLPLSYDVLKTDECFFFFFGKKNEVSSRHIIRRLVSYIYTCLRPVQSVTPNSIFSFVFSFFFYFFFFTFFGKKNYLIVSEIAKRSKTLITIISVQIKK